MIPISKPIIDKGEIEAVSKVLKSGFIIQGEKTKKLEEKFLNMTGAKYAVATNSGTAALHTTLYSIGIKAGDEVITTPFTFIASANSILMVGAKPVFVDIDENTFNIDPYKIEDAVTKRTKAILAVSLYGQSADYNPINRIAKKYKLLVIEDAAQSINATYKGKKSGNLADISCFSFYATKNIMCGEGGMITTNNKIYYDRAKRFRHHGQDEKVRYEYFDLGYNYRLTDMQAAIALTQLKRLEKVTKRRQKIASRYNQAFRDIKGLIIPYTADDRGHVYHQYTLRITKDFKMTRDELKIYLEKKGIQSNIYYPKPLYAFKHLQSVKINRKNYSVAERIVSDVLSIPVHPLLTKKDVSYIIVTISSI